MPRGGNDTTPRNPAAVSVPQSGNRTDGGPGSSKQPIRVPTGGAYGEAKALQEQQQGAPMAAGATGGPTGPPGGDGGAPGGPMAGGVFGPSTGGMARPVGPVAPGDMMAQDPQLFIRVLAAKFPHPAIRRLVDWSAAGSTPSVGTPSPPQGPPTTMSQRMASPPRQSSSPPPPAPTAPPGVATADTMPGPAEVAEGF